MQSFRIELPPFPRGVSANFRGQTKFKAVDVAKVQRWTLLLLKAVKVPKAPGLVVLDYQYFSAANDAEYYQPKDDDNLINAMKPARDALAAAKIVPDDTDKHVRIGRVLFASEKVKVPKTIMTIHLLAQDEQPEDADGSLRFDCALCKENYFIGKESAQPGVCTYCVVELGTAAARKQLGIAD